MPGLRRQNGFTLGELLILVTIVGIVAAVTGPEIGSLLASGRVEGAAGGLAGALRFAQSEAMRTGKEVGVEVKARRVASAQNGWDDGNWYRVFDAADTSRATVTHPVSHRPFRWDLDDRARWGATSVIDLVGAGPDDIIIFSPEGAPDDVGVTYRVRADRDSRLILVSPVTGRVLVE